MQPVDQIFGGRDADRGGNPAFRNVKQVAQGKQRRHADHRQDEEHERHDRPVRPPRRLELLLDPATFLRRYWPSSHYASQRLRTLLGHSHAITFRKRAWTTKRPAIAAIVDTTT